LFRWKTGGKIFTPPSCCPHCEKSIRWFDNIPVVSFLALKGRCRSCHKAISWQYPMVEIITAFFFYLSSITFSNDPYLLVFSFVFVGFLVLLGVSDINWRLLPNSFNNLFIFAGLLFQANKHILLASSNAFKASSGFIIIGSLIFAVIKFFPRGLGGGDIKMLAGLAVWVGVFKTLYVLLFAFGVGSLVVLPFLMVKKVSLKSMIPFGPFIGLGAINVWFFPEYMVSIGIAP
jgi:prepilin signal peptidase PulO-like enzyme (type II secretory pathway)